MKVTVRQVFVVTVAGVCGVVGFTLSYWLLGLLVDPLIEMIDNKIEGEK